MGNTKKKLDKRLEARRASVQAMIKNSKTSGKEYRLPGSMNKKKSFAVK